MLKLFCSGCGERFSDTDLYDVTGNQEHVHRFLVCARCKKINAEIESRIESYFFEIAVKSIAAIEDKE